LVSSSRLAIAQHHRFGPAAARQGQVWRMGAGAAEAGPGAARLAGGLVALQRRCGGAARLVGSAGRICRRGGATSLCTFLGFVILQNLLEMLLRSL
jgi:hypothetical protein